METSRCRVCQKEFPQSELITGHGIRHEIENLIICDIPDWNDSSFICKKDYENYRIRYITGLIREERGQIEKIENDVIRSISESELISSKMTDPASLKVGERISDAVATFGGSWKFIITFFIVLLIWILLNSYTLLFKPFDPYPFILMNLILSCIAAIQAPIIMMSQNRQEARDRLRSENDYKVNLKSEIEVRTLHEKMDHLLLEQWSKMVEIQQLQIDLLKEIHQNTNVSRGKG